MLDQHAISLTSRLSELPEERLDRLTRAEVFPQALRLLSGGFVSLYEAAPRVSSLFASQQRWL